MSEPSERAIAILSLFEHEGWRLVEQYLNDRMAEHTSRLLTCPLEDVEKHRARYNALNGVFIFMQEIIYQENESNL